jgi:uncharacterized protein YbjT (DUF2867 family)
MLVVTGPTGNVGAELAEALVALGAAAPPYRLAAHDPDRVRGQHGHDVPVVAFDYDDRTTWTGALAGATSLFLLFPLPSPRTVRTRMKPFIDAAVAAGVDHIVYVSVPAAADVKRVPHYHVERLIEASGASYTFLRCGYFAQNLVRAISTHGVDIVLRDEVFVPARSSRTCMLDSRDVAQVALEVVREPAHHRDRAYALTGAEVLDFGEVAEVLSEVLERPIRYADPKLLAYWWRLRRRGVTWDTVAFMTIVYTLTRRGVNSKVTDTVEQLIGRAPTSFDSFARAYRWRWETCTWT